MKPRNAYFNDVLVCINENESESIRGLIHVREPYSWRINEYDSIMKSDEHIKQYRHHITVHNIITQRLGSEKQHKTKTEKRTLKDYFD